MQYQPVKIETVQVGDCVKDKGEVVDIVDRNYARFTRLIIKGGSVVEDYYGKMVSVGRSENQLNRR